MFFCTNDAESKNIILSCIIFLYEKLKNYSIQSFKECLFFIFCLFCFLLLSNNTLHVMFYTYICYWNTFQYKYIIQIAFHLMREWIQSKQSKSNLGEVNKKVNTERESAIELTFSSTIKFQRSPCLLPKTTDKLLLHNLYHWMYDIQIMSVHRSALKIIIYETCAL